MSNKAMGALVSQFKRSMPPKPYLTTFGWLLAGIRDGALARGDDTSGPAKGARTSDSGSTGSGRRTSQADGTSLDAQAQKGAKKLAQESGNAAVKKSVKELVENSTNETVDLGSQAIGIKGAQALVVALKDNTSCTALKLDRNRFSDFGANAFAEGLPSVTHLKHLSVRSNGIRDEGAQALAKCLASTSLESLNLGRNSISESVKGQLKAAKKSCSVTV